MVSVGLAVGRRMRAESFKKSKGEFLHQHGRCRDAIGPKGFQTVRRLEAETRGRDIARGEKDKCMLVFWKQQEFSYCSFPCADSTRSPALSAVAAAAAALNLTHNSWRQLRCLNCFCPES